jgi:hypothetical protein
MIADTQRQLNTFLQIQKKQIQQKNNSALKPVSTPTTAATQPSVDRSTDNTPSATDESEQPDDDQSSGVDTDNNNTNTNDAKKITKKATTSQNALTKKKKK